MSQQQTILARLTAVIEKRKAHRPSDSYTAQLLDAGVEAVGAKVREEAGELIDAARTAEETREPVIREAADLIYHVLVMLALCDVTLADVEAELSHRFGVSGLDEKASRPAG